MRPTKTKMADRRHFEKKHFEKKLNRHTLATVRASDFDEI